MQYRIDQKSGNKLSILGLGCMRFPRSIGGVDGGKAYDIVCAALERGVNYFDTAWLYPGSEQALGDAVAQKGCRKEIHIATKMPVFLCKKSEDFDKYFNESLRRLKTDYVDYYLMHNISSIDAWERMVSLGIKDWIAAKKREGVIKQIGFSFHGNCDHFIKTLDSYEWEFAQIQYNYSDENYQAGKRGLQAAAAKNIPVIIMEPLLGGKLVSALPPAAFAAFKRANGDRPPARWGLLWLWNQREVTVVLSGISSAAQVNENLEGIDEARPDCLTADELAVFDEVRRVFNESFKVHCAGCNYCMPCPKGVNIPGCFSAYNTSYAMGLVAGLQQYITSTGAQSKKHSCASNCIQCGKCEAHCPQHIPIRRELANARRRLEPLYVRLILAAARLFLR
jgi:predicted aldo/keto reductase-like oxidoreductase